MPYGALSYLDTLSNFPEQQVNKIKLWKPLRSYFSYSPNRTAAGWYFFPFLTSVIWLPWGIYFENFTSFACQMKVNQVVFQQSETYATNCPQGAEVSCNVLDSCRRYVMTSQPPWSQWRCCSGHHDSPVVSPLWCYQLLISMWVDELYPRWQQQLTATSLAIQGREKYSLWIHLVHLQGDCCCKSFVSRQQPQKVWVPSWAATTSCSRE